jgi:hypothetical protein
MIKIFLRNSSRDSEKLSCSVVAGYLLSLKWGFRGKYWRIVRKEASFRTRAPRPWAERSDQVARVAERELVFAVI